MLNLREILFRGKREDNGDWVEGYYVLNVYLPGTIEEKICPTIQPFGRQGHAVLPDTVGQYIGKDDKNGAKIYEGDILEGAWGDRLVVYYDSCYLAFRVKNSSGQERDISYYDNGKLVVVGNIYDNPELLKEGNKNAA